MDQDPSFICSRPSFYLSFNNNNNNIYYKLLLLIIQPISIIQYLCCLYIYIIYN